MKNSNFILIKFKLFYNGKSENFLRFSLTNLKRTNLITKKSDQIPPALPQNVKEFLNSKIPINQLK